MKRVELFLPVILAVTFVSACGQTTGQTSADESGADACPLTSVNGSPAQPMCYRVVDEYKMYQGDIILGRVDDDEHRSLVGNANYMRYHKWTNGVVPYAIDPALPNPARVQAAIQHYAERTAVRWVPRTSEADFVLFHPRPGISCSSSLGRVGGQQLIELDVNCGTPEIIHEMGHAIGLWHEQCRGDRDQWITILWDNVMPDYKFNFNQDPANAQDFGAYDYDSIMHYRGDAFSANGQPTMVRKVGSGPLGQGKVLSEGDRAGIASLYGDGGTSSGFTLVGVKNAIAAGPARGAGPVYVFDASNGRVVGNLNPYPGFAGGVSVAVGDVNGDGVLDVVTGAGAGGGPHIAVFNGRDGSHLTDFFPYEPSFRGGVFVAVGDVNGDGAADIVAGTGVGGGPRVVVFDGRTGGRLADFFAYESTFRGGVLVAAADVDGDGRAEVLTGTGPGGGPRVRVLKFSGSTNWAIADFFAYDASFRGGVNIGSGDVDGDGRADVITGTGVGGGPHVIARRGTDTNATLASFFAGDSSSRAGVLVAGTRFAGQPAVVTGLGPGGDGNVRVYGSGGTLLWQAQINPGSTGAAVGAF